MSASDIPGHISPTYTEEARDDALFHYTSASGLLGILGSKEVWATAYYCTNDSSELAAGKGVLTNRFIGITSKLISEGHDLARTFFSRGINPMSYADSFEQLVTNLAFNQLSTYLLCFCNPIGQEDFRDGLLSQWRGYGVDGGYALQFSRKKLLAAIEKMPEKERSMFDLKDVHYQPNNPLREKVFGHLDAFIKAYMDHLEDLGGPLNEIIGRKSRPSPIINLYGGPIEAFMDYLIHTKNSHFSEERECRLSYVDVRVPTLNPLTTSFFNRKGLLVPYKIIPHTVMPLVDCIEWIIVGPNQRMKARFHSIGELVRTLGLDIRVRPSHIPFIRE